MQGSNVYQEKHILEGKLSKIKHFIMLTYGGPNRSLVKMTFSVLKFPREPNIIRWAGWDSISLDLLLDSFDTSSLSYRLSLDLLLLHFWKLFYSNAHISLRKFILLVYCFVSNFWTYDQISKETDLTTSEEDSDDEEGVSQSSLLSRATIASYFSYFR